MFDPAAGDPPAARYGHVDFSSWGPLDRPVGLLGEWRVRVHRESSLADKNGLVIVPGNWTDTQPSWPSRAKVTYALQLTGLEDGPYVLYVPPLYAANEIRIDGRLMSRRGDLTRSLGEATYHVRSQDVLLRVTGGSALIQIAMATGQHRDHGFEIVPTLGRPDAMRDWAALKWSREMLYNVALLLIAGLTFANFFFRPRDRSPLYFGSACFFFLPTVSILGYDNILLIAFPRLSFSGMVTLQYASGALAVGFFIAYAAALFPRETWKNVNRALIALFALFFVIQVWLGLTGMTYQASLLQQWNLLCSVLALVYITAIVVRAALRKRSGASIFLTGLLIFVATIIVGALVTNNFVSQDRLVGYSLTAVGVLMLLFPHVVIMAERWSLALEASEQSNSELRRLLEINTSITTEIDLQLLLRKITDAMAKVVHADRGSLFLHDEKRSELWGLVTQGVEDELRFPDDKGIAGHCFQAAIPVVIAEARSDPRFLNAFDEKTGYRTNTLLAVPIVGRDGRKFGVMEALNCLHGPRFSQEDVSRMAAFASQAAIAIENATLFGEVVAERNYNDSILSSMQDAVFTVGEDDIVIKCNTAALSLMGGGGRDLVGRPALEVLRPVEAAMHEEVRAVIQRGEPRSFLDVELKNASNGQLSVNLTLVPLKREEQDDNTLVVVEDISEGKRLRGTLRRFIPAQVVDQVLDREDALLFGNACKASVLFSDIRDFTALAEKMSARHTVDMLNGVFGELYEAVTASGGVVDKFIGDALMAVYGVPLLIDDHAEKAVAGARQMMSAMKELNHRSLREKNRQPLRLGIGISTGEVVAGTIGSPKRMDYTVIGDSVNLASRLQGISKFYHLSIIASETTVGQLGAASGLRELDLITVRGRSTPLTVYQVLEHQQVEDSAYLEMVSLYEEARRFYLSRHFGEAERRYTLALKRWPDDHPAQMMRDRARIMQHSPPAEDWNGVWTSA